MVTMHKPRIKAKSERHSKRHTEGTPDRLCANGCGAGITGDAMGNNWRIVDGVGWVCTPCYARNFYKPSAGINHKR